MKSMRGITTKVAGVALATVMTFGGMSVFAAENGDKVYSNDIRVVGRGYDFFGTPTSDEKTASLRVPVDGIYSITCTCDKPYNYKTFTIYDNNGRVPVSYDGVWGENATINDIDLYAGVDYTIKVGARNLIYATNPAATFTVTLTLTEKFYKPDPYVPNQGFDNRPELPLGLELRGSSTNRTPETVVPSMPQIIINEDPEVGPFNMYVGNPDADEGTTVPSMPEIVINEEPDVVPFNIRIGNPDADEGTTVPSMPEIVINEEPEAPVSFSIQISTGAESTATETNAVETIENTAIEAPEASAAPAIPAAPASALTADQMNATSVRNFVGHLYIEGLGRRATEAEITEWTDKLLCCSITATEAATQILTSSEMDEHNFNNDQLAAILDEVFDTDVENDTATALNNGASVTSVIEQLAGTDNWTSKCAFYGVNVYDTTLDKHILLIKKEAAQAASLVV